MKRMAHPSPVASRRSPVTTALLIMLCLLTPYTIGAATEFTPLSYRNQHPLYQQTLGLTPRAAAALPRGITHVAVTNDYSSIFEFAQSAAFESRVDLELWRLGVRVERGLGQGFTVSAELPFWHSEGGFLDGFLNWYHNTLHFPTGGRELFPNDQFALTLTDRATGTALYDVPRTPLLVPGDLTLRLDRELHRGRFPNPTLSWFAAVELPTGKARYGISNNDVDLGAGVTANLSWKRLHGYCSVGYFYAPAAAALQAFQHADGFDGIIGLGVDLWRPIQLAVQLHGGTPRLHGLQDNTWDGYPLDLIFGLTGKHENVVNNSETVTWQLGFSEDLNALGPSIDFTAHAQIGLEF